MFAVVKAGGKQYKVTAGDVIDIEKIDGEIGESVDLAPVLMAGDGENTEIGAPVLEKKTVTAKIVSQGKGPKVIILKHRQRKNSRTKRGHRQQLTTIEIVSINEKE